MREAKAHPLFRRDSSGMWKELNSQSCSALRCRPPDWTVRREECRAPRGCPVSEARPACTPLENITGIAAERCAQGRHPSKFSVMLVRWCFILPDPTTSRALHIYFCWKEMTRDMSKKDQRRQPPHLPTPQHPTTPQMPLTSDTFLRSAASRAKYSAHSFLLFSSLMKNIPTNGTKIKAATKGNDVHWLPFRSTIAEQTIGPIHAI